jgi:hypothetical protein
MKNQEELFREVGEAGLSGGFAVGDRLPRLKGDLKRFNIMTLEAVEKESPTKFLVRIIEALGEKPIKNLEMRYRRLEQLIKTATGIDRMFILVINNAHLLHVSVMHMLKKFHEMDNLDNPPFYPGIVFLGDVDQTINLIRKNKGVAARTTIFTKSNITKLDLTDEVYGLNQRIPSKQMS